MKNFFRKYFIPNAENNFRPHILQRAALFAMLFFILVSFTASNIQSLFLVSSDWFISAILPAVIVDLTNEERDDEELNFLSRSSLLDAAAQKKAEDMAEFEYFAHDSPNGIAPWFWFGEVGYTYTYAGENLAIYFTDSGEVVNAWMNSLGHRRNILDEHYTEIGIGTSKGEYKGFPTIFVVQFFGRPVHKEKLALVTEAERIALEVVSVDEEIVFEENSAESETETNENELINENEDATSIAGYSASEEPKDRVVYSGLATTSRLAALGVAEDIGTISKTPQSNFMSRLLSQPRTLLGLFYTLLASFIVVVLLISIVVEWRKQHPLQIAYGTALLLLMAGVLQVHNLLQAGALVI